MKPFDDNDIEILQPGKPEQNNKRPNRRAAVIGIAAVVLLAIIIAVLAIVRGDGEGKAPVADVEVTHISATIEQPADTVDAVMPFPLTVTDSINDVTFTMIPLDGFKAEVSFSKPDTESETVVLAVPAADYRADNGEIVGEFIHGGEMLSRGTRKQGYCYVSSDGAVSIGSGDGADYKELASSGGGTFFRQYPLVMEGEIYPNILRGKAKRRALGFLDSKPYVVFTAQRESIYDFSQALADYGFSHALYLPGGEGYVYMHTDGGKHIANDADPSSQFANYLIFNK